ncbi:hypothetical protein BG258_07200 [Lysinibacillus fusiformis]|uniref:Uncharacterized protein n=1 Tax=Lysinibacillus fusiformis TaxID=28031 RepID=A0A1E4RB04_9BACI|nr:hypothetical protein BG258_07200 [Lysinibacillus fusiformis]
MPKSKNNSNNYNKTFFWKGFFILFIPIFIIGIFSEPYITHNPFETFEDFGEFIYFLLFYIIVIAGISALIVSIIWRLKHPQNK